MENGLPEAFVGVARVASDGEGMEKSVAVATAPQGESS